LFRAIIKQGVLLPLEARHAAANNSVAASSFYAVIAQKMAVSESGCVALL